jgi:hypothetical protein
MVEKRLLVRDNRGGETLIEVALESLLRQWEDLAGWLAAEREDLKGADTLERAAAAWEHSGRNDAWLLEGARLAGAEELAAKPGFRDRLNPVREFLHTSRRRDEDRAEAQKRSGRKPNFGPLGKSRKQQNPMQGCCGNARGCSRSS